VTAAVSSTVSTVEQRYDRGTLWAAIAVMASWHLLSVAPTAWQSLPLTHPPGIGVWLAGGYAVIGLVGAIVVLRGGGHGPLTGLLLLPPLLLGVLVSGISSPTRSQFDRYAWAFSAVGWFALVVLWRRPARELGAFLAADGAVGLVTMAHFGELDRVSLSRFASALHGVTILQLCILIGARWLTAVASAGAQAQAAEAEVRNRQLVAESVHQSRRNRYRTVQLVAAELLAGLSEGSLDTSEQETQQNLRIAVTRLRRLIVESDEAPDPLLHEVRACADVAERRRIAVDLQATVGAVPILPPQVRRALTEPLIQVLAATRTHARVTVVAGLGDVAVGVVADAPTAIIEPMENIHVHVSSDVEEGLLWMQARWRDPRR